MPWEKKGKISNWHIHNILVIIFKYEKNKQELFLQAPFIIACKPNPLSG